MKRFLRVVIVILASWGVILSFYALLGGFNDPSRDVGQLSEVRRLTAPGGKVDAVYTESSASVLHDMRYAVYVVPHKEIVDHRKHFRSLVLEMFRADPEAIIRWDGFDLEITVLPNRVEVYAPVFVSTSGVAGDVHLSIKRPNKAPEPTPGLVTPRALE